jgi:hypothetical protein
MQLKTIMFIGCLFLIFLGFSSCKKNQDIKNNVVLSKIFSIEGNVEINGNKPEVGQKINYDDSIKTGKNSFCEIIIDDKNIIRVMDDSIIIFRITGEKGLFNIEKGFIGGVIKNRKNLSSFEVATDSITTGIRGTTFFIGKENTGKTYICICNGTLHLLPYGVAKDIKFSSKHHKGAYYTLKNNIPEEEDAGMLYHDDTLMEKIASDIGVAINWNKIDD